EQSVFSIPDDLTRPRGGTGDYRQTARHGFENGQPIGIFQGWADVGVGGRIELQDIRRGVEKNDASAELQFFALFNVRFTVVASNHKEANRKVRALRERFEQCVEALFLPIIPAEQKNKFVGRSAKWGAGFHATSKPSFGIEEPGIHCISNDKHICPAKKPFELSCNQLRDSRQSDLAF